MNHPAASRIGRLLYWLPTTSVRCPTAALSAMILITGLAGLGLTRLELRTDGHALQRCPVDDFVCIIFVDIFSHVREQVPAVEGQ